MLMRAVYSLKRSCQRVQKAQRDTGSPALRGARANRRTHMYKLFWNQFPSRRQYQHKLANAQSSKQVSVDFALQIPTELLLLDNADRTRPDTAEFEDQILLAAFASGDHDAFTTLYKRHSRSVFHFAFYMAGDTAQADELTQQVFVWLVYNPTAFDPTRGPLPAFLGGVARKFLRRQQRSDSRWSPLDDAIDALHAISLSHTPSLVAGAAIDGAQLREAIALLPIRYREVIVLCDLQEKPYAEAARILDCSIGTVRSRLHRSRNLLARKLNPNPATKGDRHAL